MKRMLSFALFIGAIVMPVSSNTPLSGKTGEMSDRDSYTLSIDQEKKVNTVKTVYTCPMHPEVNQEKSGKCPKCGMNLTAKEVKKDVYQCPMHTEVTQDKAGKCPKCGMNLVKKETEKKPEKKPGSSE